MNVFFQILLTGVFLTTQEYTYIKFQTQGMQFLDDKNWGEALFEFKQATKINPHKANPQLRIGELYQQRELYNMSIFHLEKAERLKKTLQEKQISTLYIFLASAYHHTQKADKEKICLETLLHLPNSTLDTQGFCFLALGLLHLRLDELHDAKNYLLQAEALDYRTRTTHLALAKVFAKLIPTEHTGIKRQEYINFGRHYLYLYKSSFVQTELSSQEELNETPIDTADLESAFSQSILKSSLPTQEDLPNL